MQFSLPTNTDCMCRNDWSSSYSLLTSVTYKSLHECAPDYLAELCNPVARTEKRRRSRSAAVGDPMVPRRLATAPLHTQDLKHRTVWQNSSEPPKQDSAVCRRSKYVSNTFFYKCYERLVIFSNILIFFRIFITWYKSPLWQFVPLWIELKRIE